MSAASWPTVLISVAFDSTIPSAFILDTSTLDSSAALSGLNWTGIDTDTRGFTINRGRQTALDRFQTGQLVLTLDNTSGDYDPDNTSGAHTGKVVPGVPIQVILAFDSVNYPLFYGYVDEWLPQYLPGSHSYQQVQVTASDAMSILANYVSTPQNSQGAGEKTDARINRILDNAGWSKALRQLDPGIEPLQATTLSQAAFDDIQQAVESEYGLWYIDPSGNVRFENRFHRITDPRSSTAQSTWSDQGTWGTNPVYTDIKRTSKNDLVRNLIQGQVIGGTLQQAADSTSQATTQGPRTLNNTALLLEGDDDAAVWCAFLLRLFKDPEARVETVTFAPLGDPTVLWPVCLGTLISDRVVVTVHPPVGSTVTKHCFVEGIAHSYSTGDGSPPSWSTQFSLSSATKYDNTWFILDDPLHGMLGTGTLI